MPGLGIGIGMGMGVGRAQASLFNRVRTELFGSGEQGIYMPSVHESFVRGDLYQDAAGTTPVTAVGQSVGLWLDRSGNSNHASQSTAASRPKLQQDANGIYVLRFDGVDDRMVTPSVDFTGTDKMTVLAGFVAGKIDLYTHIVNLGDGLQGNIPGGFWAYLTDTGRPAITVQGSSSAHYAGKWSEPGATVTVGSPDILVGSIASTGASYDAVVSAITCRPAITTAFQAVGLVPLSGTLGTLPLFIGRAFTRPFNGDIYGLIVCGAQKSLAQIERAEALINRYTKAY